jgi:hypothetical protein
VPISLSYITPPQSAWEAAAEARLQAEVAATLRRVLHRSLARLKHGGDLQADTLQMMMMADEAESAQQPPCLASVARRSAAAYRLSVKQVGAPKGLFGFKAVGFRRS